MVYHFNEYLILMGIFFVIIFALTNLKLMALSLSFFVFFWVKQYYIRYVNWPKRNLKMVSSKCFVLMLQDFSQPYLLAQRITLLISVTTNSTIFISLFFLILDSADVLSVVNIGATALVTEAATAIFGEAGVSAATGVMTVCMNVLSQTIQKYKLWKIPIYLHACMYLCMYLCT